MSGGGAWSGIGGLCGFVATAFDFSWLSVAFLLPLPFWREHCAESERGRHAEPRAFYGTQSRRVRASRDSCGFLSVFRLLGAEQLIAADHNPAEHCLCFACQNELPKQSNIIRRTHTRRSAYYVLDLHRNPYALIFIMLSSL